MRKRSRSAMIAGCALVLAGAIASAAPAEAGHYRRGGHYGGHYGRGGGWSPGAAAAVGIIGGLALGSVLAARPAYGGPYGDYGYGYGYRYGPPPAPVYVPRRLHSYGPPCRIVRRHVLDPYRGSWTERILICPY